MLLSRASDRNPTPAQRIWALAISVKVLKRINNNAYVIDLPPSKYSVSNTFNISDLSPYHGDDEEIESRTTLSQGGGEMM
jgi:hypothetical protein